MKKFTVIAWHNKVY